MVWESAIGNERDYNYSGTGQAMQGFPSESLWPGMSVSLRCGVAIEMSRETYREWVEVGKNVIREEGWRGGQRLQPGNGGLDRATVCGHLFSKGAVLRDNGLIESADNCRCSHEYCNCRPSMQNPRRAGALAACE